ncbi:hypothetical protein ACPPVW_15830 [Leifsonia sp. McL0607]|uniref:hypothetical protein n=1 Tax=Leifsonia sp. McL0607 TaxID=3415672 RepID=UPI003CF2E4D7
MAKKKSEKEAERALITARAAVDEAQRLVNKLDKKSRKEADELAAALEQAAKDAKKAAQRARKNAEQAAKDAKQKAQTAREKARTAASVPAASTGIPTFRDLRDRAKAQGIQGYSRMNKAQLLHALGEG